MNVKTKTKAKVKTEPWDVFEFLKTEEDIQLFVDVSIDDAKNDTDPSLLADALATAAEARRRLAEKQNAAALPQTITLGENPGINDFDKTARLFGYHVTLVPVV
jgi:DNA-binding phage protein